MTKVQIFQTREFRDFENSNLFRISIFGFRIFEVESLFGYGYAGTVVVLSKFSGKGGCNGSLI